MWASSGDPVHHHAIEAPCVQQIYGVTRGIGNSATSPRFAEVARPVIREQAGSRQPALEFPLRSLRGSTQVKQNRDAFSATFERLEITARGSDGPSTLKEYLT